MAKKKEKIAFPTNKNFTCATAPIENRRKETSETRSDRKNKLVPSPRSRPSALDASCVHRTIIKFLSSFFFPVSQHSPTELLTLRKVVGGKRFSTITVRQF